LVPRKKDYLSAYQLLKDAEIEYDPKSTNENFYFFSLPVFKGELYLTLGDTLAAIRQSQILK